MLIFLINGLYIFFLYRIIVYRLYLLVVVAAAVVDDVEVASGECEVLNVSLLLVGNGDGDVEGNHVDGEPQLMQDDDTLHAKLVGGDPKIVDGSSQLPQVSHAALHVEV